MTEIHIVDAPTNRDYLYGDADTLSDYELEHVYKQNIDEAWYWYVTGSYEGSGHILMRRGDLWDSADMGHCSCYGPTENLHFSGLPLAELLSKMTTDFKIDIEPLLLAAGVKVGT